MTREHEYNVQKDVLISGLLQLQEGYVLQFKLMFLPDVYLLASSFDWHLAGEEGSHNAGRREGTKKNCNLPCSVCLITFHVLPKLRRVSRKNRILQLSWHSNTTASPLYSTTHQIWFRIPHRIQSYIFVILYLNVFVRKFLSIRDKVNRKHARNYFALKSFFFWGGGGGL